MEGEVCTICADEGDESQKVRLECGHCFHVECCVQWFRYHHTSCPNCRDTAVCCTAIVSSQQRVRSLIGKKASVPGVVRRRIGGLPAPQGASAGAQELPRRVLQGASARLQGAARAAPQGARPGGKVRRHARGAGAHALPAGAAHGGRPALGGGGGGGGGVGLRPRRVGGRVETAECVSEWYETFGRFILSRVRQEGAAGEGSAGGHMMDEDEEQDDPSWTIHHLFEGNSDPENVPNIPTLARLAKDYHTLWTNDSVTQPQLLQWVLGKFGMTLASLSWDAFHENLRQEWFRLLRLQIFSQQVHFADTVFVERLHDSARVLQGIAEFVAHTARVFNHVNTRDTERRKFLPEGLRTEAGYSLDVQNILMNDEMSNSSFQNVFLYLMSILQPLDLRRANGWLCERVVTKSGHSTMAFQPKMEVATFVAHHTAYHVNFRVWKWITQPMSNVVGVVEYMTKQPLPCCPDVQENHHLRSYEGDCVGRGAGVYDSRSDMFFEYATESHWEGIAAATQSIRRRVWQEPEYVCEAPKRSDVCIVHVDCAFPYDIYSETARPRERGDQPSLVSMEAGRGVGMPRRAGRRYGRAGRRPPRLGARTAGGGAANAAGGGHVVDVRETGLDPSRVEVRGPSFRPVRGAARRRRRLRAWEGRPPAPRREVLLRARPGRPESRLLHAEARTGVEGARARLLPSRGGAAAPVAEALLRQARRPVPEAARRARVVRLRQRGDRADLRVPEVHRARPLLPVRGQGTPLLPRGRDGLARGDAHLRGGGRMRQVDGDEGHPVLLAVPPPRHPLLQHRAALRDVAGHHRRGHLLQRGVGRPEREAGGVADVDQPGGGQLRGEEPKADALRVQGTALLGGQLLPQEVQQQAGSGLPPSARGVHEAPGQAARRRHLEAHLREAGRAAAQAEPGVPQVRAPDGRRGPAVRAGDRCLPPLRTFTARAVARRTRWRSS